MTDLSPPPQVNEFNYIWQRWLFDIYSHYTTTVRSEATTAELVDVGHFINTSDAKVLGRAVYNTTTGVTVFASGNADADTWDFYDATTAHQPI